jgi:hypothetical protein
MAEQFDSIFKKGTWAEKNIDDSSYTKPLQTDQERRTVWPFGSAIAEDQSEQSPTLQHDRKHRIPIKSFKVI